MSIRFAEGRQELLDWFTRYKTSIIDTSQKMNFSIKDFFSKYDQIRILLRI